jgi:hypothetical protein
MKYKNICSNQIVLVFIFGLMLSGMSPISLVKDSSVEKIQAESQIQNEKEKIKSFNKEFINPQIVDSLPQKTVVQSITTLSDSAMIPSQICSCASLVKCTPCGVVLFKEEVVSCPCAPKPNCPICPPLSLIHEMAAKRAREDQRLVSSLRGYTNKMNRLLDNINRYSSDVVQFEMKAKEMAQKMEESGLKAQVARKNMYRVRI